MNASSASVLEKITSFFIGFLPTSAQDAIPLNARIVDGNLAVQAALSAQEQAKAEQERIKAEKERLEVEKNAIFLSHYKHREEAEAEVKVRGIKADGEKKDINSKKEREEAAWDAEKKSLNIAVERGDRDRQAQLLAIQTTAKHNCDVEEAIENAKIETLSRQAKLVHRRACNQLDTEEAEIRKAIEILNRQAKLECLSEIIRMENENDLKIQLLQIEQQKLEREEQRRREEHELAERRRREDYDMQVKRMKSRQSELKEDFTKQSLLIVTKTIVAKGQSSRKERQESQTLKRGTSK